MIEEGEDAKLVADEQAKLSATYTNGIAIALFAVGSFGPLVTALFSPAAGAFFPAAIGFSVICQAASIALLLVARRLLRKLVR